MSAASQRKMKPSGIDWIGDVPEGWNVTRFGYHATVKANLVEVDDYGSLPQISPENIEKNTGRLLAHGTVEDSGVISGNHLFKKGQILYSKIRPALNKVTIAPYPGLCCADMYPIETDEDTRFMVYLMLADCFVKQTETVANMRIKMPKINQGELSRIRIALPPLDEQKRIAAKLDRLCGRVDELAENIKGEIAALQEYRKSLITECVTKGLNPKAKMKPSGVDWIGDIPEKWAVMRLKYGVTKIGSGKTPLGGATVYSDDGVLFIRSQNVYDNGLVTEDIEYISPEIDDGMTNSRVRNGDVLLNITGGSIGRCCVYALDKRANVNQHVCIIRIAPSEFLNAYVKYFINGFNKIIVNGNQQGGNRESLNFEQIGNLKICVPPFDEQSHIAAFLDKRCAVIDAKIAERQKQLEKLGEYRSSVIYEYVTGKKGVAA